MQTAESARQLADQARHKQNAVSVTVFNPRIIVPVHAEVLHEGLMCAVAQLSLTNSYFLETLPSAPEESFLMHRLSVALSDVTIGAFGGSSSVAAEGTVVKGNEGPASQGGVGQKHVLHPMAGPLPALSVFTVMSTNPDYPGRPELRVTVDVEGGLHLRMCEAEYELLRRIIDNNLAAPPSFRPDAQVCGVTGVMCDVQARADFACFVLTLTSHLKPAHLTFSGGLLVLRGIHSQASEPT